jgi:uncharacterized membrane protein YsdA (DUF1294 family)
LEKMRRNVIPALVVGSLVWFVGGEIDCWAGTVRCNPQVRDWRFEIIWWLGAVGFIFLVLSIAEIVKPRSGKGPPSADGDPKNSGDT